MRELTERQQAFVQHFVLCRVATVAARRAGYAEHTARRGAQKLMASPKVREAIEKARQELKDQTNWTAERMLGQLEEDIEFARQNRNAAAVMKGRELQAKMLGFIDNRSPVDDVIDLMAAITAARARALPARVVDADYSLISAAPTLDKPVDIFEE